jgi:hypothetical protein
MKIIRDIMTPVHPRWDEFCDRLEGPEGCNFKEKKPGDAKSVTWKCSSSTARPLAKAILEDMGMDVKKSLSFFEKHGGYCDCEILFNVERCAAADN